MDPREIDVLSDRIKALEASISRAQRRNRTLVGLGLAAGLLAWAGAALSAPSSPLACSRTNLLYCFKANEPAVAEQVNSNFEALARNTESSITTAASSLESKLNTSIATRLPLSGGSLTGTLTITGDKAISGGNAQGNLHLDSGATGADRRVYLNWYSGKGVIIGNGNGKDAFANFDSSAGNATIDGRRVPSEIVSQSCNAGTCTATCPTGTSIKLAFGFHGLSPAGSTSDWKCGSAWQWLGTCIGKTSCDVGAACNSSGVWLECW